MKQAWIAGATGLVGSHLVKELTERKSYDRVNCLVRMNTPARTYAQGTVRDVPVDYKKSLDLQASTGDDFFCALGTTIKKAGSQEHFHQVDYDYVLRFAEAAKRSACHCFVVVSAMGADAHSRIFYSRVKGEMEESVRAFALRAVWVLRPSLLLGKRGEFRLGEAAASLAAPLLAPLLIGPLARYRPIEAAHVAKAAAILAQKDDTGFHILASDEITSIARSEGG